MKQKIFTLLFAILASSAQLYAQETYYPWDAQIDGIYYKLDNETLTASVTYTESYDMTVYSYYNGDVVIPSIVEYNGITYTVTEIGWEAFEESSVTSVVIPNTVTIIRGAAFASCNLTSVTFSNSVTTIEDDAFRRCYGLGSVTIPNTVTNIGNDAFYDIQNVFYQGTATGSPWGARCVNGYVDGSLVFRDDTKTELISCLPGATGALIIPESVTNIGDYAFYGLSEITRIEIPNSVTSIGESAFYGCSGLKNVTIPNSVTSIGYDAFKGVLNIAYYGKATGYPWGAKYLNKYVDGWLIFQDETKTELLGCRTEATGIIVIPESVTTISGSAFSGCRGLTSVTIPNSVTSIGSYAFSGCSGLTSVTIPNSVTSIGASAFYGCSGLTNVTISNSVTSIGKSAFSGCSGLASVTIPNSVTSIGNEAFAGCSSLTSVVWNAKNCADFTSINTPFYYFNSYDLRSQITSFVFGNEVERIPAYLCYGMNNLTSITIPNSVTSIGGYAFSVCSSLTSITIPNSVTSIGNYAFYGCTGLTSVTIGDSVTSVGDGVFAGCKSLTSPVYNSQTFMYLPVSYTGAFTIPDGIEHIAGSAFRSHSGLTEITIPASVTSIEVTEFYGCTNLTAVNWNAKNCNYLAGNVINDAPFYHIRSQITSFVFGEEVESIPDYLCYGMEKLTSITLPQSVTSIGNSVFKGCAGLTMPVYNVHFFVYMPTSYIGSYIIDAGIETIASGAFEGCIGLSSVDIPNSVTSIGNYAFRDCTSLTSVTIPNSVTSIGKQAFYNCLSLTSVTVGNSVTSIGINAFSGCSGMINVTVFSNEIVAANYSSNYSLKNIFGTQVTIYIIGESVTNIGNNAFSGCKSLTSVTIPNSIKSIGESAFSECSGVTSIDVPESVESIDADAFAQIQNVNYTGFATGLPWGALNVNGLPVISTTKASEIASGLSHNVKSSQPYYIVGKVTSVSEVNTNFGNASYYITDGTTNFYCYRLFNLFGTKYTTADQLKVGDEVTIFAYLKRYNTTLEAVEGYVVSTSGPYFVRNNFLYSLLSETETSIQYIGNTSELTEVTIPSEILYNGKRCQITHIGSYAFSDCSNLKHVEMPDGITSIGTDAFKNCKALTNIKMPKSVANIGEYAFSGCTGLTSIELPEAITNIGKNAFNYCTNMPIVILRSETPPTLGEGAFNNCTALTDMYVPCGTLSAYTQAWQNYSSLIKYQPTEYAVDVAMNIEEAGSVKYPRITCDEYVLIATPNYGYHFVQWNDGNTGNPRAIEITQDAAYIAEFAIDRSGTCGDDNLLTWKYDAEAKLLTISGEGTLNSNYTYGVEAPTQVESLIIGSGVTSIGDEAFKGFSTLKSVELSSTVTTIGNSAFENCSSLEELSLGENITKYGEKAFAGCEALTSIYNYRSRPAKLGTDAFKDVDYFNCTLYVLAGSVDMYKSSGSDWKDFYFIEPISAESASADEVVVVPHDNSADISWPKVAEAETYELKITKDGEVFCVLVFNTQGQLVSIAFAPSRYNAAEQAQAVGFSFTVTGLNSGTQYGYSVTASNSTEEALDSKSGIFMTTTDGIVSTFDVTFVVKDNPALQYTIADVPFGTTIGSLIEVAKDAVGGESFEDEMYVYTFAGVENTELTDIVTESTTYYILYTKTEKTPTSVSNAETSTTPLKFLQDGQLFILREGKMYDVTGVEVR